MLLLNGSVLCLDAASMDILLRQIALAYGQQDPDRSQAEPQVADVLQYADVAEWFDTYLEP